MGETDNNLFRELRQRNVFRVGAAYLVIAWLLAQIAELGLDSFEAPAWVIKALLLVLALGFPVTLFLAWAYELTPDGVKRESQVDRSQSITASTGRKLNYLTIGALSVALVYFMVNHDWSNGAAVADGDDVSIAVLPFADLSENGDQEYFSDGISEEILNVLVRIPDLKVAGRTSSFSFKGRNEDLRVIGAALGVNHVLEGSVRRAGERLRITAQLIRSNDGFHVWSETFDRQVADIFDIQDEIAEAVAQALATSFDLAFAMPDQQRTADIEVYEDYLKARQLFMQRGRDNLDQALLYLNGATTRDPEFAPAWSLTAAVYGVYEAYAAPEEAIRKYEQWRSIGKAAAERALSLRPDSAFAHSMLGLFLFYDFDFIGAFQEFDRSVELAPDDAAVLDTLAQQMLDVGYFREANGLAQRAVAIDPLAAIYRNTLGRTYHGLNNVEQAMTQFEKAIELDPSLPFPYNNMTGLLLNAGDIDGVRELARQRVVAGITSQQRMDEWLDILELRGDDAALMALARQADEEWELLSVGDFLEDSEQFLALKAEFFWQNDYRHVPDLFNYGFRTDVYASPAWKAQIRKDGVLALWQSRGFPSQCRPLGEDDFECQGASSNATSGQSFVH